MTETNPQNTSVTKTDDGIINGNGLSEKINSRYAKILKKILKIMLIGVIPLILIFMFYYYFFIFLSPKAILLRNVKYISNINRAHFSSELTINFTNSGSAVVGSTNLESHILKISQPSSYKILAEGYIDKKDNITNIDSNLSISSDDGKEANILLKARGGQFFINLKDSSYSDYIDKKLLDNWILIDDQFINNQFEFKSLLNVPSDISSGNMLDEILSNSGVTITDRYPSDKVKGIDSYHFKFTINKSEISKILTPDTGNSLSKLEFKDADVWIGKKKGKLYRIKIPFEFHDIGASGTKLDMNLDLTFYDFSNESTIEFPENFIKIEDFLNKS